MSSPQIVDSIVEGLKLLLKRYNPTDNRFWKGDRRYNPTDNRFWKGGRGLPYKIIKLHKGQCNTCEVLVYEDRLIVVDCEHKETIIMLTDRDLLLKVNKVLRKAFRKEMNVKPCKRGKF